MDRVKSEAREIDLPYSRPRFGDRVASNYAWRTVQNFRPWPLPQWTRINRHLQLALFLHMIKWFVPTESLDISIFHRNKTVRFLHRLADNLIGQGGRAEFPVLILKSTSYNAVNKQLDHIYKGDKPSRVFFLVFINDLEVWQWPHPKVKSFY